MNDLLQSAIRHAHETEVSYSKYLSPNDTKSTKSHQSGYLIGKSAWSMFLDKEPVRGENIKLDITIKWQDDFQTDSIFTYYGSAKDEFRITTFGKNFPFREEENVGDLFILCKKGKNYYNAYIFSHDEDIEAFFEAVNISSTETNKIIQKKFAISADDLLMQCFLKYLKSLTVFFPPTIDLAVQARNCFNSSHNITSSSILSNPDQQILNWSEAEFNLFKLIENDRYHEKIKTPFTSVEELILTANSILQRRKSRAGSSLEHQLAEIFNVFKISYSSQGVTEDNKTPDFIFPSRDSYNNPLFNSDKLIILAAKRTCKDRWRQIINEADRVKIKHLFTLQQGISKNQLEEMYKHNVCLVVPKAYLSHFPEEFKHRILTLQAFNAYTLRLQQ